MKGMTWMLRLLTVVVLFSACTKEFEPAPTDPQNNPGNGNEKKLSKMEYDDGSYTSINYNTAGQIAKLTVVQKPTPNNGTTVYTLTYNGTKLTEMVSNDGYKFKYTYTGNDVTKVEMYAPNNSLMVYYEYTYKDGRLWRTDAYNIYGMPASNVPSVRFENEYYANGNLKKMVTYYKNYTSGALQKTGEYEITEYDSKRNTSLIFENNPFIPMNNLIPNNPTKEKHYDEQGTVYATVTHSYTYDADGHPLTRTSVVKETGLPDETTITRFYY